MSKKTIKLSIDKQGRYEVWKLNRKGYYNFECYLYGEEGVKEFLQKHKKDEVIKKEIKNDKR